MFFHLVLSAPVLWSNNPFKFAIRILCLSKICAWWLFVFARRYFSKKYFLKKLRNLTWKGLYEITRVIFV